MVKDNLPKTKQLLKNLIDCVLTHHHYDTSEAINRYARYIDNLYRKKGRK